MVHPDQSAEQPSLVSQDPSLPEKLLTGKVGAPKEHGGVSLEDGVNAARVCGLYLIARMQQACPGEGRGVFHVHGMWAGTMSRFCSSVHGVVRCRCMYSCQSTKVSGVQEHSEPSESSSGRHLSMNHVLNILDLCRVRKILRKRLRPTS